MSYKKATAPPAVSTTPLPPSERNNVEAIYPSLNFSDEYRLSQIKKCEEFLEHEIESRTRTKQKYVKTLTVLTGVECGLMTITAAAGTATTITGATGIGIPVAIPLGAASIVTAAVGMGVKALCKFYEAKTVKHRSIKILAEAKLNTIASIVSKALKDLHIANEEFQHVLDEIEKYKTQKRELRSKHRVDRQTRDEYFQKGKEAACRDMMAKFMKRES